MAFTTNIFLFLYLPLCVLGYYLVNLFKKLKINNLYLVFASLVFYAWSGVDYALYFVFFIFVVYVFAHLIEYSNATPNEQRKWLIISLVSVLGILFYYKYFNFVINNMNLVLQTQFSVSEAIIPLGISFIIFESISYLLDVQRGYAKAASFFDTALFLSFFPKVISGPIVLWRDFAIQIRQRNTCVDKFHRGVERIMIGFAKKVIIADTLGEVVSTIVADMPYGIDQLTAIIGGVCYAMQLYYDFSGYSDIAIGLGCLFGFDIKENFNFPYTSKSITEFWRRWHVSLGRWFREYIYIPLGGNRKGNVYFNLFVVFMATGIWHGANWNFIIWGVLHALIIVLERKIHNYKWYVKIPSLIKWLFTSLFIYFTWIIFMLPTFKDAILYIRFIVGNVICEIDFTYQYYFDKKVFLLLVVGIMGAIVGGNSKVKESVQYFVSQKKLGVIIKDVLLLFVFAISIVFMVNSTYSPFLYFQF